MQKIDSITKILNGRDQQSQTDALNEAVKYLDRLQDKFFSLNNLLIAGYFALIALDRNTNKFLLLVPLMNMLVLIIADRLLFKRAIHFANLNRNKASKISVYIDYMHFVARGTTIATIAVLVYLIK
jgi:hypothetical protein